MTADAKVMAQFFCLFRESNYGVSDMEAAAWIMQSGAGATLSRWPSGDFKTATWVGPIPSGVIAFVHTHPNSSGQEPSTGDKIEAKRIHYPCYVVSGGAIWRTDGTSDAQVALADWWKPYKKTKC